MTTITHVAVSSGAYMFASVLLRFEVNILHLLFIVWAGLLPDADTNKSIPGWLFQRIFYICTFTLVDLNRITEHRGLLHSFSFAFILAVIFYFINPVLTSLFLLGIFTHLFLDSMTKTGISITGFGDYYGRFSTKWNIQMRSASEYAMLAASLVMILLCMMINSKGGASHIIRKNLGTLKACIEDINSLEDYNLTLVVEGKKYRIVDAFGSGSIILLSGNVPVEYGFKTQCEINASGRKAYVKKEEKIKTISYQCMFNLLRV